jgi:hypothetical protein
MARVRRRMSLLCLKNNQDRHNRNLVDRVNAGILDHNDSRRGAYVAVVEQRVHADKLSDANYLSQLRAAIGDEMFDAVLINNSDVAEHVTALQLNCRYGIVCCEAQTVHRAVQAWRHAAHGIQIYAVPQIVDLQQMASAIVSAFPDKRICYISGQGCPIDRLYCDLLRDQLEKMPGGDRVHLSEYIFASEFRVSELPSDVDLFAGRYFVHERAPSSFFQDHPFISGYMTDFERGAIAAMDINDEESGRLIVESILIPLAHGIAPETREWPIGDVLIRFNLHQARRFGLTIPSMALRLGDEVVGEL